MIKKLIALFAMLVLMVSAAGCVAVGFNSHGGNSVRGQGTITSESFECGDFTKLSVKIPGELYYTAGKPGSVTIELHENLAQYLNVFTDNGALVIDSNRSFSVENNKEMPKIYVSTQSLEDISVEGVVDIKSADKITADSFTLVVDGVFNGTLDLDVKNLIADISGVGDLTLNGTADNAKIDMSGVGSLKAFGLQTKEADVENSGVGSVEISCSDKLIAEVSGVGGVTYKGDPSVTPNVSGVGGLKKAN